MISLVLPVYNCYPAFEASLPACVSAMKGLGQSYELIVVDDCSREGTPFRELSEKYGCIYIRNQRNRGKGYSVRMGFARATGEIQLFMDGDFPFELTVIERMILIFREATVDLVIGDRTLPASRYPKALPVMRKIGSRILSMFAGHIFTPGYFDTQCGVKGFRKAAAGELFPDMVIDGFSFDMEILYVALKRKYRIERVPVEAKRQEASHVRVGRHGLEMLANLFKISYHQIRGKYDRQMRGKYDQARGRGRS